MSGFEGEQVRVSSEKSVFKDMWWVHSELTTHAHARACHDGIGRRMFGGSIPRVEYELLCELCPTCLCQGRPAFHPIAGATPILSSRMGEREVMDHISSKPNLVSGVVNHILTKRDHFTKLFDVRATHAVSQEVTEWLHLSLRLQSGVVPSIAHLDNGGAFLGIGVPGSSSKGEEEQITYYNNIYSVPRP